MSSLLIKESISNPSETSNSGKLTFGGKILQPLSLTVSPSGVSGHSSSSFKTPSRSKSRSLSEQPNSSTFSPGRVLGHLSSKFKTPSYFPIALKENKNLN